MSYVIDTAGERAEVVSQNETQVTLRLSDGQTILVPHSLLLAQNDGSFRLAHSLRGLLDNQLIALPVIEEELQVTNASLKYVTRRQTETCDPQTYAVRREEVTVERVDQDV